MFTLVNKNKFFINSFGKEKVPAFSFFIEKGTRYFNKIVKTQRKYDIIIIGIIKLQII
jgi:hypothetical protein